MMDDDDATAFANVLSGLKTPKRDPRSVRLAAVTAAMIDVIGDDHTPSKIYASTVTTLESSLNQEFSTQVALLELLRVTIPHVNPATLEATIVVTSRVLRAVVLSCQTIISDDEETKDELGGINATMRACCRTCSQFLLYIPTSTPEKLVKQLYSGVLLALFSDARPKVRKAAQQGAKDLLGSASCHKAARKKTMEYCLAALKERKDQSHLLHTLSFLEQTILFLNVEKLSEKLMELIVDAMSLDSSSSTDDFVAKFTKRDATQKVVKVNALLSILASMMEASGENEIVDKIVNNVAGRVLATLLQMKPLLVFTGVESELSETGKILYGRLVLLSTQRVVESQQETGVKLAPLATQQIVQLVKPTEGEVSDVADAIMSELTKLIRLHIRPIAHTEQHCCREMLQALEVVVQYNYRPTWSATLNPLALLMQLVPDDTPELIETLIKLRIHVAEDGPSRLAVEEALSSLIQEIGIVKMWSYISWHNTKSNKSPLDRNRSWLLPLLRTSSMAASSTQPELIFFQTNILELARKCDAAGNAAPKDATFYKSQVTDLWSLFSCFCVNPTDISSSLPILTKTLVRAMGDARYPQLVTIICGGLKILAEGVMERRELQDMDAEVFSDLSPKLLPSLFKLVETMRADTPRSSKESKMDIDAEQSDSKGASPEDQRIQSVNIAIGELAKLAPQEYLQSLLKKVIQRLLGATQSEEDETEKVCTLLGLSQALVSSKALDETSIGLLYRAVKPFIRSDENPARVQKRAYKVLLEICQIHVEFVIEADRLKELTELLVGSIMTCQISARHMRLKCMTVVVDGFDSSNSSQVELIPKIVGEVLLCLKDSNGKTREAGYKLLMSLCKAMDDMLAFFKIIAAALGAQTPHLRSAAVMAMSRLVFEFARVDTSVHEMLPMMLQTVIVLFGENSREVIKSAVGFVRVSVAAMSKEQLEPLLPDVVGALFKYHKGKDRFRAKIKIILKRLVRIFGYETLMPLVPESDTRILTHMRKLSERAQRRKAALRAEGAQESNDFDEMMESDEEDSDDGKTLMTGATKFTEMTGRTGKSIRTAAIERKEKTSARSRAASTMASNRTTSSGPRLMNDQDGNVLDMLDPSMSKSVRFAVDEDSGDDDSDGAMEFDDLGRLVVPDDMTEKSTSKDQHVQEEDDEDDENLEIRGGKKRKISKFETAKNARDEAQKKAQKKQTKALGAAYKSKKSGGDVRKKGQKFEPYAYVPLDGKSYTKKNRRQAVESMATVVRGGKRKRR